MSKRKGHCTGQRAPPGRRHHGGMDTCHGHSSKNEHPKEDNVAEGFDSLAPIISHPIIHADTRAEQNIRKDNWKSPSLRTIPCRTSQSIPGTKHWPPKLRNRGGGDGWSGHQPSCHHPIPQAVFPPILLWSIMMLEILGITPDANSSR